MKVYRLFAYLCRLFFFFFLLKPLMPSTVKSLLGSIGVTAIEKKIKSVKKFLSLLNKIVQNLSINQISIRRQIDCVIPWVLPVSSTISTLHLIRIHRCRFNPRWQSLSSPPSLKFNLQFNRECYKHRATSSIALSVSNVPSIVSNKNIFQS